MPDLPKPSERAAYLILMFLHQKLTVAEQDELDEWVCASDENLAMFEELTDVDHIYFLYRPVIKDEDD